MSCTKRGADGGGEEYVASKASLVDLVLSYGLLINLQNEAIIYRRPIR